MKKILTSHTQEQFFSLMSEEEMILFLHDHQKHKNDLCEGELRPLTGTHTRQTYAFYIIRVMSGKLRYFSVDVSYWWDFEMQAFNHRVESVIEYPDKAHQLLLMHCETLLYENSESY